MDRPDFGDFTAQDLQGFFALLPMRLSRSYRFDR